MKLGYFAMPMHAPDRAPADFLEYDLWQVELLDRLGFVEAWIGEHSVQLWEPITSPDLFIAAALQRTETIRLGTGVSCLPHHHPLQLAQRIAFLDQLSRGRINFGIGTSGFAESETWGLDWKRDEHRALFREVLDAVLEIWAGPEPGRYEHRRFSYAVPEATPVIALRVRPYQQPHPPIGVACISARSPSLVLAGANGWLPMSINLLLPDALRQNWETYSEAAAGAGRSADRAVWRIAREVHVADTPERAREEALNGPIARGWREHLLPTALAQGIPFSAIAGPDANIAEDDIDGLMAHFCEHLWVVGDVDGVTAKLNALYDEVGGFGTLLVIAQDWQGSDAWEHSMRLLRDEVQPRLRDFGEGAGAAGGAASQG